MTPTGISEKAVPAMRFDHVYRVSDNREVATARAIAVAEQALGRAFPPDYPDYVTTLGRGLFNGRYRVYMPDEIEFYTGAYRDTITYLVEGDDGDGFSFWENFQTGLDLLSPAQVRTAVAVIDADNNNRIIAHPDVPAVLFYVPRECTEIVPVGRTLEDALTWLIEVRPPVSRLRVLTRTGDLREAPVRYFEPDQDRERVYYRLEGVPFMEMREHLVRLAQRPPEEALFVSEACPLDDGTLSETIHLFVKEYGGAIWCNDGVPEDDFEMSISYDRTQRTAPLDDLLEFCRRRAFWVWGPQEEGRR
jgi:hypothetical protein